MAPSLEFVFNSAGVRVAVDLCIISSGVSRINIGDARASVLAPLVWIRACTGLCSMKRVCEEARATHSS